MTGCDGPDEVSELFDNDLYSHETTKKGLKIMIFVFVCFTRKKNDGKF